MSGQGYYLKALTAAIKDALPEKCRRGLDSWMENGTIQLCPKDQGQGVDVGRLQYDAVIYIERLPFRETDPATVLAIVAGWLQDHDDEREGLELPDPTYAVTPDDDNTADLEITVTFSEPLRLLPDVNGPVRYDGQRYTVAPYEIWVAEHGELTVGSLPDAPLDGQP